MERRKNAVLLELNKLSRIWFEHLSLLDVSNGQCLYKHQRPCSHLVLTRLRFDPITRGQLQVHVLASLVLCDHQQLPVLPTFYFAIRIGIGRKLQAGQLFFVSTF